MPIIGEARVKEAHGKPLQRPDGEPRPVPEGVVGSTATTPRVAHHLATTIDQIVHQFKAEIGLWPT